MNEASLRGDAPFLVSEYPRTQLIWSGAFPMKLILQAVPNTRRANGAVTVTKASTRLVVRKNACRSVACPQCHAQAGQQCTGVGAQARDRNHQRRVSAYRASLV